MAIIDEEEKRKRAEARRAEGAQYQQKRDELLAQNAAIKQQAQTQKKASGQKASYKPMTSARVDASIPDYRKRKTGDYDMAKVAQSRPKETYDVSTLTYEEAMGVATRIVYDDERDDFLKKWQKSAGNKQNKSYMEKVPTLDDMRTHLNSQKPGGLYASSGAAYSKQVKEQFEADYKAIQENKKNQATISTQMTALSGLTDVSGNALDVNTASLEEIIKAIKADPDEKRREAFAGAIKTLTKTQGSRFYGVEFDEGAAKEFINSAALTQEDYDDQVDRFAGRFNPLEGHEQENLDEYAYWVDQIENGGFSDYVRTAYRRALDAAYRQQTQKDDLPDLTNYVPPQKNETEEEKKGWVASAIESVLGRFGGEEEETDPAVQDAVDAVSMPSPIPILSPSPAPDTTASVEPMPAPTPTPTPTPKGTKAPDKVTKAADKVTKAAQAAQTAEPTEAPEVQGPQEKTYPTLQDAIDEGWETPEKQGPVQQESAPEEKPYPTLSDAMNDAEFAAAYDAMQEQARQADAAIPQGSIDLAHDPVAAAAYMFEGKADLLTRETQEAVDKLVKSSPGIRAILKLDVDATKEELEAAQGGDVKAMAYVDGTRTYWATGDASAIIGSTLGSYLALSDSDAFPQELRTAMQGALLEIVVDAEDAYERGEFEYDPKSGTIYDAYIRANPQVMQTVRGVKKAVSDMYLEQRRQEKLAADEAAMNEQALLEEHRAQVRSGTYTPEAYAHVIEKAPLVTIQTARADAVYREMAQEIDVDRTLSDGMDDSWYNQMADRYLRENGRPLDLGSVEAMLYKDSLAAYEKDVLLSDMRAAQTLGYSSLGEMYEAWGGMDIDKLHMRAEALMARDAKEATAQAVAVLDEANSAYMGTGENANVVQAAGAGFAHGSLTTGSEMLEGIWSALSIIKEDMPSAVYNLRRTYTKAYGPALASTMYVKAMEKHMQEMSPEHAQAIQAYLDEGYDPFRLGIDPMEGSVLLDAANVLGSRAASISDWATKTLNENQGRWFDAGSATGSTLTMQTAATLTTIATRSGFLGTMIGYGLPGLNQETKAQLAAGKSRKDALLMGGLRAGSDTIANMITSDRFTQKWLGFMGFGPKVALGANAVGDVAASRSVLGMAKRYGGAFITSTVKTGVEEAAIDQPLETLSWQFFGSAGEALIDGANVFKAAANGLKNIDVMEALDETVKNAGVNFISAMPLAIIGGALDTGSLAWNDKLRGSRQAAVELSATGTPEAAQAFVEALTADLENPAAVDQLNQELKDAAIAQEAAVILVADEEVVPVVETAEKAQEQADAHAQSEENSRQAAQTGLDSAIAAQERMNAGEVNPELVTQVAYGVQAHAKNSQSVLEHQREKEQKQAEADTAFAQAMQQAWEKAYAEIAAQEEARRAERAELEARARAGIEEKMKPIRERFEQVKAQIREMSGKPLARFSKKLSDLREERKNLYAELERIQEEYDSPLAMDQAAVDEFFDEGAEEADIDPMENARVMEVEEFIEQVHPEATEEQRAEIYDAFFEDEEAGELPEAEEPQARLQKANAEFAARVSRKFGVKIRFGDLGDAEGAYSRKADTIFLDTNATQGDVIRRVMVHELTHRAEGTKAYGELEKALIYLRYGSDNDQLAADIESKRRQYESRLAEMGRSGEFDEAAARKEIVADISGELFAGNDEMINRLVADKPSVARQILDAIKSVINKLRGVRDPEIDNLRRAEKLLERGLKEADRQRTADTDRAADDAQFALRWSKDGKRYVEIEEDILAGVPEDQWAKTVMDTLRDRFKDGIPVGNNIIRVTKKTRKEWSGSGDTKWFRNNDKQTYADKMRASGSADEIVQVSGDYVNEEPTHSRNDATVDFARGKVLMSIGGNDYEAEVVTGSNPDGSVFLYDLLRMTPTGIQKKTHRPSSRRSVPRSRDASSDNRIHENDSVVNTDSMQNPQEDARFSLPSAPYLRQEASAWRKAQQAEEQREESRRKGERKFVTDTLQASRMMPTYLKETLFNDPTSRYYDRDSNDEQIIRAYQTIQQEGREAVIERILSNDNLPTRDDIAQANVLMAMAAQEGDMSTLLALSRHYAADTTEIARSLQAQKIFKRMTPIGIMQATAAQAETAFDSWRTGHEPKREDVEAEARKKRADVEKKDGSDPIAMLGDGKTVLTRENSKWGIPINEQQAELIRKYKLEKVTRPGIHYNRATLKQRMLEAILATPNVLEMTNEGLTLIERLEYMKAGAPVVTNADLEYIGHQMAMYAAMDADSQEGRIGQLALARAYEANANITQAGIIEKINGARYINMLMNATSPMRNVIGNTLMTGVNSTSDAVANALDTIISLGTGKHTKALITPKEMIEGWEAFRQETIDTFRDYFVDQAIVKQGEGRFDVNRRGRIYQGGAAETARLIESFAMSVGDRNFWKMAYVNSMNEQMRVAQKNGVELDYEAARAQAEQAADYATFNEDNKVRAAMNAIKNAGVFGKIIDLLMPFTGVPTNIVKRQLEYGPAGLAYSCVRHGIRAWQGKNFDQRAFVEEMARGLTGTGLAVLGYGLKELGMIHSGAGEEEEYQAYYMRTARGDQYTPYITVGDQNISLSTFAPAVSPILMGAAWYDAAKNDVGMATALGSAMSASLDSIIDASYFSALQDILAGDGTFSENLLHTLLETVPSQSIPSISGQFASSLDPYVRDTKDKDLMMQALKKAMSRIPGVRELLPIKYDVTGEAVKNTKEGWRAFLDPFTTTEAESDRAVDELMALYERTGETKALTGYMISSGSYSLSVTKTLARRTGTGDSSYSMELTTEQKQEINRRYGEMLFGGGGDVDGIRNLVSGREWERMSDEERVEAIADMRSEAKAAVTEWAIKEYGKTR